MFGRMDKKTTVRNAETDYPHFAPSKVGVCAVQTQGLSRPNLWFAPSKVTQKILTPPLPLPYMGGEGLRTNFGFRPKVKKD